MRYYLLDHSQHLDIRPHIIAEVTSFPNHENDGAPSLAREIAERYYTVEVLSREELLSTSEGRRAFREWASGDDSQSEKVYRRTIREAPEGDAELEELRALEQRFLEQWTLRS